MSRRGRLRVVLAWVVFAEVVGAWFVCLRPPVLGGSTAYVFVRGTSMEPTYHTGDLVLVTKRDRYHVGDIAAFAVAGPGGGQSVVIHRVIAVEPDGTHILQGDNRDEPDPWHPTHDEIVGTPMLAVPAAGRWLAEVAARPLLVGLLCAVLAGLVMLTGGRERSSGPPVPQRSVHVPAMRYPPVTTHS